MHSHTAIAVIITTTNTTITLRLSCGNWSAILHQPRFCAWRMKIDNQKKGPPFQEAALYSNYR
jgi:hypothetical protein